MKSFIPVVWNSRQAENEVARLRTLLTSQSDLSESGDVLPLIRAAPQLALCIGECYAGYQECDRISFEFDLFGDFACDLVVGSERRRSYVFVEFEGAEANSIFRRQAQKATRECAPPFARGFFQILDWFTKLASLEKTDDFENRFGARVIEYTGVLVIGRDAFLDASERRRFEWWRTHCVVNSRHLRCITFDELLADVTALLTRRERPAPRRGRKP